MSVGKVFKLDVSYRSTANGCCPAHPRSIPQVFRAPSAASTTRIPRAASCESICDSCCSILSCGTPTEKSCTAKYKFPLCTTAIPIEFSSRSSKFARCGGEFIHCTCNPCGDGPSATFSAIKLNRAPACSARSCSGGSPGNWCASVLRCAIRNACKRAATARFASHWNGCSPSEVRSRFAAFSNIDSGEFPCGRDDDAAACSTGVKIMAPSSSAVSMVNRRNVVRIMKTPASIEHDGDANHSTQRNRRLQKGSWPGGQGEEILAKCSDRSQDRPLQKLSSRGRGRR